MKVPKTKDLEGRGKKDNRGSREITSKSQRRRTWKEVKGKEAKGAGEAIHSAMHKSVQPPVGTAAQAGEVQQDFSWQAEWL
eukprot:jgi/Psemu1/43152/gm1.43152_g